VEFGEIDTATVGLPQVPAVKLLLRPFRILPEPILLLLFDEMAEPSPVLPPNELLLMQRWPRSRP